jgi:hypothetical protein
LPQLRQAPADANPRADARAGRLRHAILRFVLTFDMRPAILAPIQSCNSPAADEELRA